MIAEIVLVNNATDKEYRLKSDNDFGFSWFINDSGALISVNQLLDFDENKANGETYIARGRYHNFSITEAIWKEVEIKRATEKDLWVKK